MRVNGPNLVCRNIYNASGEDPPYRSMSQSRVTNANKRNVSSGTSSTHLVDKIENKYVQQKYETE